MDRTLISWNLPNMITVPLMAFGAFLIVGVIWQVVQKYTGGSASSNNSGGY